MRFPLTCGHIRFHPLSTGLKVLSQLQDAHENNPCLSKCADLDLISKADVVFVFDDINAAAFKQRHPDQANKLVKLSAFSTGDSDIEDPDGQELGIFKQTYVTIDTCLNDLALKIKSC